MKVAHSCPTLYDPMEYTVHGILQARILEWVAFPFSRGLPNPGIKPGSPVWQADSLPSELPVFMASEFCVIVREASHTLKIEIYPKFLYHIFMV